MTTIAIDIPQSDRRATSPGVPSSPSIHDAKARLAAAWSRFRAGSRRRAAARHQTAHDLLAVYRDTHAAGAFARLA